MHSFLIVILAPSLFASSFYGGIGFVEEGDDRLRPASVMTGEFDDFSLKLTGYGRRLGSFTEQSHIVTTSHMFSLHKDVVAKCGAAIFRHAIKYKTESDESYNFGAHFGLSYRASIFTFDWDSHLYLAGSAGLFLVTARQQVLSIGIGVNF